MRTEAPLLAPLFRSEGQARLLAALLLGDAELSITDLAARAHLAYPTAHREVARLLDAGILRERNAGRTRLIGVNNGSPLSSPLREILLIVTGPVALLADEFSVIDGIESVFLYGSFAARVRGITGPPPNDIDVMVVGTPDPELAYAACERVQSVVGRAVNPTIVTRTELEAESGFFQHIRENPIVPVWGDTPWA